MRIDVVDCVDAPAFHLRREDCRRRPHGACGDRLAPGRLPLRQPRDGDLRAGSERSGLGQLCQHRLQGRPGAEITARLRQTGEGSGDVVRRASGQH
jgi:hypothetical protein